MASLHEFSVLGYLLTDNDMLVYVESRLNDDHFQDKFARRIYGAMKELRQFDPLILSDRLKNPTAFELLLSHTDEIATGRSVPPYCDIIIRDYTITQQKEFLEEVQDRLKKRQIDDLDELYEEQVAELRYSKVSSDDIVHWSLAAEEEKFLEDLDKPTRTDLIPFYMPKINEGLGYGVVPKSLVMLSGTPKDGKTTIALQQTWWLSEHKYPTAFISFEQGTRDLFEIMVGQRAKVSAIKIRNRSWEPDEKKRCIDAARYLSRCPIYTLGIEKTDPIHCFKQIKTLAENGVKWITLDHLQLMCEGSGETGFTYKIKDITRKLKLLAGQMDIVIFLIAQNQQSSDVVRTWGSNVPEQDVDAWLVFNRPGKDDNKNEQPDYIVLHRNRLPGSKRVYVETLWSPITNQNNEMLIV